MRILLVDDDHARVETCDSLLRTVLPNLDLEHVATQPQAITRLAAQAIPRYDVALIGTDSPDRADLALLAYIREQNIPLAVVFLLGEASPMAAAAALAAGADGYAGLRDSSPEYMLEVLEHARRRHGAERIRRAHPRKVLYVDWDQLAVARVRHQLLTQATSVQIDSVPTAEAAFRLLTRPGQQTTYDALLLAHRPPCVDALATLQALRKSSVQHFPVVALVAPGDEELGRQVLALGAIDVLVEDDAGLARLGTALVGASQVQVRMDERTSIESAPIGMGWITPDGHLLRANQALQALLGYGEEELRRHILTDVVHPDDAAEGRQLYAELIAGARERYERDVRAYRKDGSLIWMRLTVTALRDPDGTLHAVAAAMQDVTEWKELERALSESQRRYAQATAAGGVGVWDFDYTTGAGYTDPVLYALIGFNDVELDGGALWQARVHPEDAERMRENERISLDPNSPRDHDGNTPIPEIEYRMIHRDGSIRWFLNRGTVQRHPDGMPRRVVGTTTGITTRKQHERRLAMEYAVSQVMSANRDLAASAYELLYHVATGLGYDHATLWVVDAAHTALRCLATRRIDGSPAAAFEATTQQVAYDQSDDLLGQAWLREQPAIYSKSFVGDHSPRIAAARAAGFAAGIAYPIRHGGTVIGVLELLRYEANGTSSGTIEALRVIAAQLSQFIMRKQAEAALRETMEFRERILESAVIAIATLDLEGRFTLVNRRVLEITGYSADELLGSPVAILLPPDQREAVVAAVTATLREGTRVERFETELVRSDGGRRWVSFRLVPLMSGDTITGAVGTAEEITERRETERALRQSERRYRALFEQASDPIFIVGNDGATLDVNELGCDLLDYRREELLAMPFPSYVVTDPEQFATTRTLLLTGAAVRVHRQLRRKDGTLVPVEIVARTQDDGRIQAIVRDMSERERAEEALRESEARFRALYDAGVMPICFWRADGGVSEANDALLALTGFSREEVAAGLLRWDGLTVPEHRDRDQRAFAEVMERGSCAPYEKDLLLRDGRRVTVLNGGMLLLGQAGGGVAFVIDLTEQKQAEARLRELTARLLQAQDEERRRIARELHDVTAQDLFAITMFLAQLEQPTSGLDRPALELVGEARTLANKALRELRTTSYLLHPPLLDEVGLSAALEWYVEGFARRSGVAVDLAVDDSVGRLPTAVEIALFRIAQEGLGNIHRHAGSDTARIALARGPAEVVLRVEDRGHGLPHTFEREDMVRELGVGIPGMRERLRQLGGNLEIASSEQGTVVIAVIPVREGEQSAFDLD